MYCFHCAVMKSLNSSQDYWQMDRVSSEHKIDKLQEELERVTLENNRLLERGVVSDDRRRHNEESRKIISQYESNSRG